jgi:hypothetical protein
MSERFDTFSPPPPEPDLWEAAAEAEGAPDEPGGGLDPHEAAALLEQATRQAEREFDARPPFLFLPAAVTVFVAYGVVWLSVHDQHPYSGPAGWALGVLYGTLALWIVLVATVLRRALSGRSSPQRRIEGATFAVIWICVYVFEGVLHHAGASNAIAFGIWPAVAPLIVVGSAAAAYEAVQGKRTATAFATAVVVLGSTAAFAGPTGVWAVLAIGLSTLLLAGLAVQLWQRRP